MYEMHTLSRVVNRPDGGIACICHVLVRGNATFCFLLFAFCHPCYSTSSCSIVEPKKVSLAFLPAIVSPSCRDHERRRCLIDAQASEWSIICSILHTQSALRRSSYDGPR